MAKSSKTKSISSNWKFLDERENIISEAHARPAQPVLQSSEVFHLAFTCSDKTSQILFRQLDENINHQATRHVVGEINGVRTKMEKHTEFISATFFYDDNPRTTAHDFMQFLNENFPMSKLEIIVIIELSIHKTTRTAMKCLDHNQRIYGGKMRAGLSVRSAFIPDENGIITFAINSNKQEPRELGRRMQRLIEMETYRIMSMRGLPLAREIMPDLAKLELELEEQVLAIRNASAANASDDEALFQKLTDLSEHTNELQTQTRYRFAASRAYYALFEQRLNSLEEIKEKDLQTMSGFLRSRMEPAMATLESIEKRQQTLTSDISRALTLLRTRIELNLNKANQSLLASMDKRHDQQLKISQTVEGLSIVAISYYALGLLSYLLKYLAKQPWMPLSADLLSVIAIPFVVFFVWLMLRRLRSAWEKHQ